ncbi:MAG: hypothetical protein ACLFQB_02690 [Chitinispirillaceae bacterium]
MEPYETVVGYFHLAGSPNYPEKTQGEQPVYYEGKQVGTVEYTPDGKGNIKVHLQDIEGRVRELGSEKDPTKENLE